jgi:hypothetical protein
MLFMICVQRMHLILLYIFKSEIDYCIDGVTLFLLEFPLLIKIDIFLYIVKRFYMYTMYFLTTALYSCRDRSIKIGNIMQNHLNSEHCEISMTVNVSDTE